MITKENFKALLEKLDFTSADGNIYSKHFDSTDCKLEADFKGENQNYEK